MDYLTIIKEIKEHGSEEKKAFTKRIIKTSSEVISGAPIAYLEKLAKNLLKEGHHYDDFPFGKYYEIDLIIGFLIVFSKDSNERKYALLEDYMKRVDNWALVDTISSRFKVKDYDFAHKKILEFITAKEVYLRRFGYIHFLSNFIKNEEYLKSFLFEIKDDNEYIVQMAIAWLLATAFIYHQDYMLKCFDGLNLSNIIKRMTVNKLCDSKIFSPTVKQIMKEKRKNYK